jgi:hypothetical protein
LISFSTTLISFSVLQIVLSLSASLSWALTPSKYVVGWVFSASRQIFEKT